MYLTVHSQELFYSLSSGTCSLVFYSFLKIDFDQNAFRSRETYFHHELIIPGIFSKTGKSQSFVIMLFIYVQPHLYCVTYSLIKHIISVKSIFIVKPEHYSKFGT